MAKKQDTISIGFEEKIWKAADILRGNLSASQYEGVVLGLIFLKYISDRFEQKFQELQGDEYADPEDKDEYTAENIFFVPAEARWSKISAAAHTPEIGVIIDEALTAIERENERLKGILPKNFARPELDKRRLGDVVDLFTNIEMHDAGEEKDLLGRTYEYCLQQFASFLIGFTRVQLQPRLSWNADGLPSAGYVSTNRRVKNLFSADVRRFSSCT